MNQKNLTNFIQTFNFADHNWKNVPVGFPNCDVNKLSEIQRTQFEGIKIAWLMDSNDSYEVLGKSLILNKQLFIFLGNTSAKTLLGLTSLSIITFILLSVIYYLNVRFNLGLSFMYNVFS